MFDFVDVSLVFLVAVLAGYAVYAVRAVLAAQSDEEQLWVDTPNMHYIPFSLRQLQSALLGANDGSKGAVSVPQWREFIIKTELVFNARYHLLKTALLDDFEPFDPNLDVPNELPESKLQLLEDRFLSNFRHMMEKGNYTMLTQKDCDVAQASTFLNTVPIEPEWLKMEPLFQRYLNAHPEWAEEAFEGSKRLWVFHRGVGVATFRGTLFLQKLDALLFRMFGRCCGKKKKKVDEVAAAPPAMAEAVAKPVDRVVKVDGGMKVVPAAAAPPAPAPVDAKRGPGVERISIRSIAHRDGWGSLAKAQTIQEPTFKEIVLAYRINQQRDPLFGSGNPHSINIKVFRDIPHADLEVCYPCKTTRLRPLDVVKFVGAGIFGLISILTQRQAGELVGYSALTGFLTLAVSVLFDYQYHQSVYEQTTLRDLYSKSKDSDHGALTYLMEQVGIQEVKEVFLGYFFLVNSPKPLSQDELDQKVELFLTELQTVFGHRESKIDFEADDALDKLVNMHLVTEVDGKFTAVPVADGLEELNAQWAGMLQTTTPK